jgi:TonB family protein
VKLWDSATGRELRTIFSTEGYLSRADFCCDGSRIVTQSRWMPEKCQSIVNDFRALDECISGFSHVRIRDAVSGEQVSAFAGTGQLSPDRRRLALKSRGSFKIWNLETGRAESEVQIDPGTIGEFLALSRDSSLAAIGNDKGTIFVWDTKANKFVAQLNGHISKRLAAVFSPDGRILATASLPNSNGSPTDAKIRVWNVPARTCVKEINEKANNLWKLDFSSDQRFMLASYSGMTQLWDAKSWEIVDTFQGFSYAAISPDNRILAADSETGPRIWDLSSGKLIAGLPGGRVGVTSQPRFSPDGHQVLIRHRSGKAEPPFSSTFVLFRTQLMNGNLRLWNTQAGFESMEPTRQTGSLLDVKFSPDGSLLMSNGANKVLVWDAMTGLLVRDLLGSISPNARNITSAIFSPDGKSILTVDLEKNAQLFNIDTGRMRAELPIGRLGVAIFNRDGSQVVTGAYGKNSVKFWNSVNGKLIREFRIAPDRIAPDPADFFGSNPDDFGFSPDEKYLLAASAYEAWLWNISEGKKVADLPGFYNVVNAASFTPDSKYLVGTKRGGEVCVWETATGAIAKELQHGCIRPFTAGFSPDGKYVVVINYVPAGAKIKAAELMNPNDRECTIWEVGSWRKVAEIEGLVGRTLNGAFSPDGRFLVVTLGSVARVVELATGKKITDLARQRTTVNQASFSPDGKNIATANEDGTTYLYPWEMFAPYEEILAAGRSRITRSLSCEERNLYLNGPPCPAAKSTLDSSGSRRSMANQRVPIQTNGVQAYVLGLNGISRPVEIHTPLPSYTEAARKAKIQGILLLTIAIRKDGTVGDIKVLRGLGYGLDESAIDTIFKSWRFVPAMKPDGTAVEVQANIEVSFRLYRP